MKIVKNKKYGIRVIAFGTAIVVLFIIGYIFYPKNAKQSEYVFYKSRPNLQSEYVFFKRHPTIVTNMNEAMGAPSIAKLNGGAKSSGTHKKALAGNRNIKPSALFSGGKLIYSHTTLEYFKHLDTLFKSASNIDDYLGKVRAYLFDHFPPAEAQVLFNTYSKYLQCEMDLAKAFSRFPTIKSPEDAIALLEQIQTTWRARLGKGLADMIFDGSIKATEYALRKAAIVNNKTLDGNEKESMIRQLDQETWGDQAQAVEDQKAPFNRYMEKLKIYKNDMKSMTPSEREAEVEKFRKEYFPPKVVQSLNNIDEQAAAEKAKEAQYDKQQKAITDNSDLTDKEKHQQILELQNETFGKKAKAFRRREAIANAIKKPLKPYVIKKNQSGTSSDQPAS